MVDSTESGADSLGAEPTAGQRTAALTDHTTHVLCKAEVVQSHRTVAAGVSARLRSTPDAPFCGRITSRFTHGVAIRLWPRGSTWLDRLICPYYTSVVQTARRSGRGAVAGLLGGAAAAGASRDNALGVALDLEGQGACGTNDVENGPHFKALCSTQLSNPDVPFWICHGG